MLQDGNITNLPNITVEDLSRAYDIYGKSPEFLRGKMTKRKVSRAVIDTELLMEEKSQVLYSGMTHIDGSKFLITTGDPLQLTQLCLVTSESANQLGLGLQGHINTLRSRGFTSTTMVFPGVIIDVSDTFRR